MMIFRYYLSTIRNFPHLTKIYYRDSIVVAHFAFTRPPTVIYRHSVKRKAGDVTRVHEDKYVLCYDLYRDHIFSPVHIFSWPRPIVLQIVYSLEKQDKHRIPRDIFRLSEKSGNSHEILFETRGIFETNFFDNTLIF